MIEKYQTTLSSDWTKLTIKKSRFFSRIYPIKLKEDIKSLLENTKREYKNPTHIVYAYRLIDCEKVSEYCTDAGEPANSSGPPILKVIKGAKLLNVCLIIVRFFGGIKLGIGGLIKAYTISAQKAIENCQIITRINYTTIHLTIKYNELGTVINKIEKSKGKVEKIEYGDVIKVTAKVPYSKINLF
ncbi:MAG: YigZ family protein [Candidatus Cloacimonetes bacterium]|nr:YigZ family protein [Candidatus Cloacimonadota bacterium]MCK4359253.1 YigZ family protein [Candidatus Cloacimonadota bacterium]